MYIGIIEKHFYMKVFIIIHKACLVYTMYPIYLFNYALSRVHYIIPKGMNMLFLFRLKPFNPILVLFRLNI